MASSTPAATATPVTDQPPPGINVVVLRGHVSSAPRERTLPSGSVLLQLEVTTRTDEGAISVPVVWFDPPGRASVDVDTSVDTEIVVVGQVRRRYFRAGGATQSRTEVVAQVAVAARRTREAERAVARVLGALVPTGG